MHSLYDCKTNCETYQLVCVIQAVMLYIVYIFIIYISITIIHIQYVHFWTLAVWTPAVCVLENVVVVL